VKSIREQYRELLALRLALLDAMLRKIGRKEAQ
jgi:hypothetical protein